MKEKEKEIKAEEINFDFYDKKNQEAVQMLFDDVKGKAIVTKEKEKKIVVLMTICTKSMREHNSRIHQIRSDKKFVFDLYKYASGNGKENNELRKALSIDVNKLKRLSE